jgi:hypothetical protein
MAILTVHQWTDVDRDGCELRRQADASAPSAWSPLEPERWIAPGHRTRDLAVEQE